MARASTRTILSLDRWAAVLGLEPRHFNQITTTIRPQRACHQPWLQYNWQAADRVGREEVAQAIAQAEADIVQALGFYPLPQWVADEVVRTAQPNDRTLVGGTALWNTRGLHLSVQAGLGQVITGGIEAKDLIATAVRTVPVNPADTMALSDPDGDGYDERVTITLPTALTDINEIRIYFAGQAAADEWEIRPLRSVTIAAGTLTITLDKHLIADPDLAEALDPQTIDGDVNANFVLTLDVYRVWNDPSQQAQMQWERVPGECGCGLTTCAACAWGTQWACLQTRDPRLGIVTYQPATWDAADDEYDPAVLAVNRAPERVRLYYQAGYQFAHAKRSWHDMDPTLERMIAYYSVTILDRPICTCDNVTTFVARWNEDLALVGDARYQITNQDMACPWGTRAGAVWAWKQVQRYAVQKAVLY